jgi:hypothetical protein
MNRLLAPLVVPTSKNAALIAFLMVCTAVPSVHGGQRPKINQLPTLKIPAPSTTSAPSSIPSSEHDSQIFTDFTPAIYTKYLKNSPKGRVPFVYQRNSYTTLTSPSGRGRCYAEANRFSIHQSPSMTVQSYQKVRTLRTQWIEESKSQAILHTHDFWVDGRTGGTREVKHEKTKLFRVVENAEHSYVYAYRDAKNVVFVFPKAVNGNLVTSDNRSFNAMCSVFFAQLPIPEGQGGTTLHGFLNRKVPNPDRHKKNQPPTIVRRTLFSASISQTSSDKEPILSVSLSFPDPLK